MCRANKLMGASALPRGIRPQAQISYSEAMTHYGVEVRAVPRRLAAQDHALAPDDIAGESFRTGGG
ncbi:anti-sigma-factor antagonist [Mycolicibacterium novocastrense]|uniref:Anti-sigma-factor antagonist n=1 Tax=Mycolicibacterium novocastrense TaxID=59813 RepID=A0ABQ0KQ76_MYCNV|nr:anti-sigma-factor antagonist [Mycolicibacterium novocastrense]